MEDRIRQSYSAAILIHSRHAAPGFLASAAQLCPAASGAILGGRGRGRGRGPWGMRVFYVGKP